MVVTKQEKPEAGHVRLSLVRRLPLAEILPSPENDKLYRPVDPSDPEIVALAESIKRHGLREPIVVTQDGWILSGHRRYAACKLAGLSEVPVRIESIRRTDDIDAFVILLREYNRQRTKSRDEVLREEIITVDPDDAYHALIEHREERSQVSVEAMDLGEFKGRKKISRAKRPFADAVVSLVNANREYWPLTDRRIHYLLLNSRPLRHATKRDSAYRNDGPSYKDLTDLLTRLRLAGEIPMRAIEDETRSVARWAVHPDPRAFARDELSGLLKGYWRDLMRSQPNHIEILGEKNTVKPIVEKVAARYTIPTTTGRGYASLAPRWSMADRFRKSGKERLILLVVSDADPEGMDIAASFGRSMRDDFGIEEIDVVKVALTPEQARDMGLPEDTAAKLSSSRAAAYIDRYGEHVWELEALPPDELEEMLVEAIDAVIDVAAFNAELDAERTDSTWLESVRRTALKLVGNIASSVDGDRKSDMSDFGAEGDA